MFKKLSLRIISYVLLFSMACIASVGITSFFSMQYIVYDNFQLLSEKVVTQNLQSISRYFDLLNEKSKMVTTSPQALEMLELEIMSNYVINFMNNICRFSGVIDATLYSSESSFYYDANNRQAIPLESLIKNDEFKQFVQSGKSSAVFARTNYIPYNYEDENYTSNEGLITSISKITNEHGKLYGYLTVDINPAHIYNYFYYSSAPYLANSHYFFVTGNGNVLPNKNQPEELYSSTDLTDASLLQTGNNDYIVLSNDLYSMQIYSYVSTDTFNHDIHTLLTNIIIAALIFTAIAFVAAILICRSVTAPLKKLLTKMKKHGAQTKIAELADDAD